MDLLVREIDGAAIELNGKRFSFHLSYDLDTEDVTEEAAKSAGGGPRTRPASEADGGRQLTTIPWHFLLEYPPPLVSEVNANLTIFNDPFSSARVLPPYILRDIDSNLDATLQAKRIALLVGVASWGKTRTAFESIKRIYPTSRILIPGLTTESLSKLLNNYAAVHSQFGSAVLWLDDIDRYFNEAALNVVTIRRILLTYPDLAVVATLRSEKHHDLLQVNVPTMNRSAASDLLRSLGSCTVRARGTSDVERKRAKVSYPQENFETGIGETLGGVPKVIRRFDDSESYCPEAFAISLIVADWQRAGIRERIGLRSLNALYRRYAERTDLAFEATQTAFKRGLKWACQFVDRRFRLLHRVEMGDDESYYWVQDFLVEHVAPRFAVGKAVWQFALEDLSLGNSLLHVGVSAFMLQELEIAKLAFEKLGNSDSFAVYSLGICHFEEGKIVDARKAFRAATEMREPGAFHALAYMLAEEGDMEGAVQLYRTAADLGVTSSEVNLGILLEKEGDIDGAKQAFRAAIDLGHLDVGLNLGLLLRDEHDMEGARRAFRTAADADNKMAAFAIGLMDYEEGDFEGAKRAFRRAADMGYATAVEKLGRLLYWEGDIAGARSAFDEARRLGYIEPPSSD